MSTSTYNGPAPQPGALRSWFDDAPVPHLVTEIDGTVTYANPAARHALARTSPTLVGASVTALFDEGDRDRIADLLDRVGSAPIARSLLLDRSRRARVTATVHAQPGPGGADELHWTIALDVAAVTGSSVWSRAVSDITQCLRSGDVEDLLATLCEQGALVVGAVVGVVLVADASGALGTAAVSSDEVWALAHHELRHVQGPTVDAYRLDDVVHVADVREAAGRWPRFVERALDRGVHAVLAVPMRVGDEAIGGLCFGSDDIDGFDARSVAAARALADLVALGIAARRTQQVHDELVVQLQEALDSRVVIEQAKGILAERASLRPDQAFHLLRRHARNTGQRLRDVCAALVDGRLRTDELRRD